MLTYAEAMKARVKKFNMMLVSFLDDLGDTVPTSSIVADCREWFTTLVHLDSADTTVLMLFMKAMQGATDFLNARSTSIFDNFTKASDIVTKEDAMQIYRSLTEQDKVVCWRYLTKLYTLGEKACPRIQEQDQTSRELTTTAPKRRLSPIQSLINLPRNAPSNIDNDDQGSLVHSAFDKMCVDMLEIIQEETVHIPEAQKACQEALDIIHQNTVAGPDETITLLSIYSQIYTPELTQALITDTENTVRKHGFPLLQGGADLANIILSSTTDVERLMGVTMQTATICLTLTSMSAATIAHLELIAKSFCDRIADGTVDISAASMTDPSQMLAMIGQTGLGSQLMDLLGGM